MRTVTKRLAWAPVVMTVGFLLAFAGCRKPVLSTHTRLLLGTAVTITVLAPTEEEGVRACEAAFEAVTAVEALMSPKSASGDIYRVNAAAGGAAVRVSAETLGVLERALDVSKLTGGAFDVSFASIGRLWDYGREDFRPPSPDAVRRMLPLVDYRKVELDRGRSTVRLALAGMRIGLGGIAKGHAIAKAVGALRRHGVRASIVDAGGDLQVSGTKSGEDWRVGLRHPRSGDIALVIAMRDGEAVATSGDYERYRMYRGRRYHHIIDPKTGYPSATFASVSVAVP